MKRRIPLAPAEGWLTLGLVTLICLTMAWALDDARWVLGRDQFLDFLPAAAIGGVLVAFVGVKVGWGRWLTYLVGALLAALVLPILSALAAGIHGATPGALYHATADASVEAWIDLAVKGQSTTIQYLHHILAIGILVWATSMFASYATFGHHRPLNGIVAVGIVLVGNMAITFNDQLVYLVVFSLASLFLLIRGHVFDEQSEWVRRRIGDPASISSVYLRGGTIFIGLAVAGSMLLTQTASSKPLQGAWDDVGDTFVGLSRSFSRFLPTGGQNRALALTFGPNAIVQQQWQNNDDLAFTVQWPPADDGTYYWRAFTYDRIDLTSASVGPSTSIERPADQLLLKGLADDVTFEGHHQVSFVITPDTYRDPTILSPQTPVRVNVNTSLTAVGDGGYFATVQRDGHDPYTVEALTPVDGNEVGQLNEEALRAASTVYPDDVKRLYLGVAEGQLGPDAEALEAKILAEAKSRAPYDLANQIVKELNSSTYKYATDVREFDCSGLSTVECFARFKHGFCQYYATTMAVLLRKMDVPTRLAVGFLPGTRDPVTGEERVLNSNAHEWVEVYFPGFGWVSFDPTGGNVSQLAPLPSGKPVASARPLPSSGASEALIPPGGFPGQSFGPAVGPIGGSATSVGPLVGVGVLLLLIVLGIAFIAWQRGPRGAPSADGAYGTVVRLASRLGFGPRPTQTVYEYAGALGDILPDARPELQLVALAKVESSYGRVIIGDDRLASLRLAQRRLRVSLLRLVFRRKDRRRMRRR